MTDTMSDGTTTEDIVGYAEQSNEQAERSSKGKPAPVTDDQPLQTELLARGEQKREPLSTAPAPHREGEHQMKGIYAEVNPIEVAQKRGLADLAVRTHAHQHGDANTGSPGVSRVRPGVDSHTDLAIANDTRVAGGREVLGNKMRAPDPEGIIKEEAADITEQLVESDDLGATVVLPEEVDREVPPFTDRIPAMEYDEVNGLTTSVRPRPLSEVREDAHEAYADAVDEVVDPEPAERDEIADYNPLDIVEAEIEYLTEQQAVDTAGSPGEEMGGRDPLGDAVAGLPVDEQPGAIERPPSEGGVEAVQPGEEPEYEDSTAMLDETEHGPDDPADDDTVDDEEAGPPAKSANKDVWVDYVTANYEISREDAEAQTKEQLIKDYG